MKTGGLLLVLGLAAHAAAWAQAPGQPPRTPDGHPDLTGVWTNPLGLTPLERNPNSGEALVVSAEQAQILADSALGRALSGARLQVDFPDDVEPVRVRGEYRTRMVIDPPDGKIPYLPAAQKAVDDWFANYQRTRAGRGVQDPDELPLQDRCITHQGTPPMMTAAGGIGAGRQIVQTTGHVMIYSEQNGEARFIRMGGVFQPSAIRSHWGDSVGHWEGDVLVVETVNFRLDYPFHGPTQQKPMMIGPNSKVIERLTRVSDSELVYAFTVEDPSIYARPWLAEYAMTRSTGRIFEYACHEGNYAIPLMLSGARADERKSTAKADK